MRPVYCDESIWIPVADGLKRRGWSVHTVRDLNRLGQPDHAHLEVALENDWILVTFDDDFLSLVEREKHEHAGIVFVQQSGRDIGDVVRAIDEHLEHRDSEDRSIAYC